MAGHVPTPKPSEKRRETRRANNHRVEQDASMLENHLSHMRTAVRLARYALDHNETPVACILVLDGHVVSWGINDTNNSLNGTAHAEFQAIDRLRERLSDERWVHVLSTCTLYVTVEPCVMCAAALRQLGVGRVVFGCANERFGGNGTVLAVNRGRSTPGPEALAVPGVLRREAVLLLRYFYVRSNSRAPKPRNKQERQLDLSTFPPLAWDRYLTRSQFAAELGSDFLPAFDSCSDLNKEEVEWALVDEPCAGEELVGELERKCEEFMLRYRGKRIKR